MTIKFIYKFALGCGWLVAITLFSYTYAQQAGTVAPRGFMQDKRERVESLKIAYISREAGLTAEEAKVFWPEYNAYQNALTELRQDNQLNKAEMRIKFQSMTDAQLMSLMDKMVANQQKEADLFKEYHQRYLKILPPRKVALVYAAEQGFKRELLNRLRDQPAASGQ